MSGTVTGLPFGLAKPDFLIIPNKGSQKLQFGLKQGMWILEEGIYPNFSFQHLVAMLGANEDTDIAIKKSLVSMNQTDSEKAFFLAYAQAFNMGKSDIPVLIPQAWVQWHSLPKRDLRATDSRHTDELYRIDFVSFWKNRRFAILVDDISHYSMKQGNIWKANEEAYSKRLKEDRKLRKEKWRVFRVSNWEIRNSNLLPEILEDLRVFMDF